MTKDNSSMKKENQNVDSIMLFMNYGNRKQTLVLQEARSLQAETAEEALTLFQEAKNILIQ